MSQTRRSLGNSLKDNPFIKRDPRWTPTPAEKENPLERIFTGGGSPMEVEQSPTPKSRGRSFTPQEKLPPPAPVLDGRKVEAKKEEIVTDERAEDAAPVVATKATAPPPPPPPPAQEPARPATPPPAVSPAPHAPPPEAEAAPPPDVSTTDNFQQTGAAQDDLFDDTQPVDDSMRVRSEDDLFGDDFTPLAQPVVEEPAPQQQLARTRGDGQQRGRGRGRGKGRGGQTRGAVEPHSPQQNGLLQSRHAPAPVQAPPEDAPSGPRKETHPSVRGDRRATGGNMKPKLTEEELAEKMARIQVKNASLTAAHARAEADAASFAEREEAARAKAAQKSKEERRDRQQMVGERERNRQRKMKAMQGREWDAEKEEQDFGKGGKFDGKGFGGDKEGYTDGREYLYREPRNERQAGGGGGGGGVRGGRGGGRGGGERQGVPPKQEDFPALPVAQKQGKDVDLSSAAAAAATGKSWADQVESSA